MVVIDFSEELIIFVVESKAAARMYRKFFENRWKKAKKMPGIP